MSRSSNPLPSSFDGDTDFYDENRGQKFIRRLKEDPLIPLGCVVTAWALYGASVSIRRGDHARTNRMFRARIYAQGFTILAAAAGSIYWKSDRVKRREYDALLAQQKSQEKRDAWIRELEARDEEEKELAAQRAVRRKRREQGMEPPSPASSMVERGEERRRGVLEMVMELRRGEN